MDRIQEKEEFFHQQQETMKVYQPVIMVNAGEMRHLMGHMLHDDPMGIENPLNHTYDHVTSALYPVDHVKTVYKDDRVTVTVHDLTFDLMYNGRSSAELASELTDIIDFLTEEQS